MDDIALRNAFARLIGPDAATRLHRIELASATPLLVERWQGDECLSDRADWQVDVLCTDAGLALEDWLGAPARLLTRLADGGQAVRSGLVREAALLAADGGLARYRLHLAPWTWLLRQGRHSRVFQERPLAEILASVFADYAPLAAWRFGDEVAGFLAQARPRSYCVQYRETDFDFVSRLLAEEGLGWRIQEDAEAAAGHVVWIFADSTLAPEDPTSAAHGGLRFHRSDATEAQDALLTLGGRGRIGSNRLTLLSDDYRSVRALGAGIALESTGAEGPLEAYDPVGAYAFADQQEAERYARLMAQADEAGRDRWLGDTTARGLRAGTWFRPTQLDGQVAPDALLVTAIRQVGINNLPVDVRDAVDAALGPAPDDDDDALAGLARRAASIGHAARFEALPRDRPWRPVLEDGTGARLNPRPTSPGYQTAIVVGPDGATAPDGVDELYCDALGRIRVRFHFQQGDRPDDRDSCWLRVVQRYAGPGVGSQFLPRIGQEVLVAFLEGDIDRPLVVGALYNGRGEAGVPATPGGATAQADASAYAQAGDHRPSAQANLAGGHAPPWHGMGGGDEAHRNDAALWGLQSKEWGGSGHSRLVFDDSDGQLRLQLATTQVASQLNLGHLIHQAGNYRGSFRGEGFELRTDAWGAVRGEAGLWLTAYAHAPGTPAGEAVPQSALLAQAQTSAKTFSDAAATHLTVALAAHLGSGRAGASRLDEALAPVPALHASVRTTVGAAGFDDARADAAARAPTPGDDRVPHLGDAVLGLSAPAGIGLVAGQSLTWSVGETLTLASGGDSHLAVAGDLRAHAGQAIGLLAASVEGQTEAISLSLVSGEGEVDLQAQNDEARLRSRDGMRIVSANAAVDLAAGKTVHLATAGGASLTIEGGNIVIACPGEIRVHAAKKSFGGPVQIARPLPVMPQSTPDDQTPIFKFTVQDIPGPIGVPIEGEQWRIVRTASKQGNASNVLGPGTWKEVLLEGKTDASGEVKLSDAQSKQVWDAVSCHPGRVYLVHGLHAVALKRTAFAMSDGQKAIFDTLEANNYIRTLDEIPEQAKLGEMVGSVEYQFDTPLSGDPKDRTKI
ncbi:type VI secretion system Vgr family protein [Luteimonas sp. FCS-9]|uniref:type VI secretion system Vgr family protein n=1 Tax=Luteimonas sp. FCS-9 TaxID=1547516 RepID=UPI0009E6573E|nr:type VI secretion system Vgr family protein [Luteimonas sp. FCS-9]